MEDFYQKLLDASFHFVSFRPRSEKETRSFLEKKLQKHKISESILLERVITRLRELDYINDEKFVAWWVDQRQTHKPKGMRLITQELKAKGVPDDLIKTLFVKRRDQSSCGRNEIDTDDELALAKRALEKKIPQWRRLSKLEQKKKIYGFLGRRGFDSDTIRRVIRDWDV